MSNPRPLASILRPKHLNDYVGQAHLLAEHAPIRQLCENKQLCSMILWGPPGCGKTSLVNVLQQHWALPIVHLSAINSGVKDIKALSLASTQQKVDNNQSLFDEHKIVFVDEIHRFNKAQQDAFLPLVENGDITLIGATTENPAFSINNALMSRMRVFTLKPLGIEDLKQLFHRAIAFINEDREATQVIIVDEHSISSVISLSNGDARKMLSTRVLACNLVSKADNFCLSSEHIMQAYGNKTNAFDKDGDYYYDVLSAFHKSIRGSDVDAGLFWFARLLISSSDIVPICRRLLAIASEDIGNADPKALQVCLNAWDVYHRVGQSEGECCIAQAVIYCALAPKSNAVYMAFTKAKQLAKKYSNEPVPFHLRNATSSIVKELGHGVGYEYAHNFPSAFAAEQEYLPTKMTERNLYEPSDRGFEKQLSAKMAYLDTLRKQSRN